MTMQQPQFVNNEIYHASLRGVGDVQIFKDINDYYRGIFSVYEFDNTKLITIRERRKERLRLKEILDHSDRDKIPDTRDLLVEILAFCFMPNHIHLLLRQIKNRGITEFMRKVGLGYAGYFNAKYHRKGHLFQRFRAIHIAGTEQLKTVLTYIHANPISLIEPGWKENGIKNTDEVLKFLENYKWSSYQDCLGIKNFPSVTEREFMLEILGGAQGCKDFVENWVKYKGKIKQFPKIILD